MLVCGLLLEMLSANMFFEMRDGGTLMDGLKFRVSSAGDLKLTNLGVSISDEAESNHFCSLLHTCSIPKPGRLSSTVGRNLCAFVTCGCGSSLEERTKPSTAGRRPLPSGLKFS